jgi:hypothetical protein
MKLEGKQALKMMIMIMVRFMTSKQLADHYQEYCCVNKVDEYSKSILDLCTKKSFEEESYQPDNKNSGNVFKLTGFGNNSNSNIVIGNEDGFK